MHWRTLLLLMSAQFPMKYRFSHTRKMMAITAFVMVLGMVAARLAEAVYDHHLTAISSEYEKISRKLEIPTVDPVDPVTLLLFSALHQILQSLGLFRSSDPGVAVQSFGRILLPGLSSNDLSPPAS